MQDSSYSHIKHNKSGTLSDFEIAEELLDEVLFFDDVRRDNSLVTDPISKAIHAGELNTLFNTVVTTDDVGNFSSYYASVFLRNALLVPWSTWNHSIQERLGEVNTYTNMKDREFIVWLPENVPSKLIDFYDERINKWVKSKKDDIIKAMTDEGRETYTEEELSQLEFYKNIKIKTLPAEEYNIIDPINDNLEKMFKQDSVVENTQVNEVKPPLPNEFTVEVLDNQLEKIRYIAVNVGFLAERFYNDHLKDLTPAYGNTYNLDRALLYEIYHLIEEDSKFYLENSKDGEYKIYSSNASFDELSKPISDKMQQYLREVKELLASPTSLRRKTSDELLGTIESYYDFKKSLIEYYKFRDILSEQEIINTSLKDFCDESIINQINSDFEVAINNADVESALKILENAHAIIKDHWKLFTTDVNTYEEGQEFKFLVHSMGSLTFRGDEFESRFVSTSLISDKIFDTYNSGFGFIMAPENIVGAASRDLYVDNYSNVGDVQITGSVLPPIQSPESILDELITKKTLRLVLLHSYSNNQEPPHRYYELLHALNFANNVKYVHLLNHYQICNTIYWDSHQKGNIDKPYCGCNLHFLSVLKSLRTMLSKYP